jgi:phosphohistidine phosphatase
MPDDTSTRKTLYLMRHAHAEPWHTLGDKLRPLDELGRDQARRIGALLQDAGITYVLTSSAARTRQTVAELKLGTDVIVEPDDDLYGGGSSFLIHRVFALPDEYDTALVCGHNPDIASAVHRLADPDRSDPEAWADIETHFPTATCCQLEFGPTWRDARGARLVRTLRTKRPRA